MASNECVIYFGRRDGNGATGRSVVGQSIVSTKKLGGTLVGKDSTYLERLSRDLKRSAGKGGGYIISTPETGQ